MNSYEQLAQERSRCQCHHSAFFHLSIIHSCLVDRSVSLLTYSMCMKLPPDSLQMLHCVVSVQRVKRTQCQSAWNPRAKEAGWIQMSEVSGMWSEWRENLLVGGMLGQTPATERLMSVLWASLKTRQLQGYCGPSADLCCDDERDKQRGEVEEKSMKCHAIINGETAHILPSLRQKHDLHAVFLH